MTTRCVGELYIKFMWTFRIASVYCKLAVRAACDETRFSPRMLLCYSGWHSSHILQKLGGTFISNFQVGVFPKNRVRIIITGRPAASRMCYLRLSETLSPEPRISLLLLLPLPLPLPLPESCAGSVMWWQHILCAMNV
jgi:hypothetical protein